MGSYLSKPETEKSSTDESNDKINCGASSMQGWRVSQEDAHNVILDFDKNTSLFAVYDGHGGHEVAEYCSQKLPHYIKSSVIYKENKIEDALIEGFLGFDDSITKREVVSVLKEIVGDKEADEDSDEEENVNNLYEEATMPIEQVIEKYTSNLVNPSIKGLRKDSDKVEKSPFLKAKKDAAVGTSTGSGSDAPGSSSCPESCNNGVSSSSNVIQPTSTVQVTEGDSTESVEPDSKSDTVSGSSISSNVPDIKVTAPDSSDTKEAEPSNKTVSSEPLQNGDSVPDSVTSSSNPIENGEVHSKGKSKAAVTPKRITPVRISSRIKESSKQLYKKLLDFEENEESDEEDENFVEPHESSSDEEEGVNDSAIGNDSDDSSEDEEDDDDEDEDDEDDVSDMNFTNNMKEEPGSDSGCTAVVALLKGDKLYVANAGDSRCIVCRNGQAIEMSVDHKPEDEPERDRIVKAGGRVTLDGRVNSGLNLSRAIGDHAYKQNKLLSSREQMITALPDVKTLIIDPTIDEFMVLACDGIWNSMSSQEVVDFVRPKLKDNQKKLSEICEELFDQCLAPNTMGDGTGCDNMTSILVQFKNIRKRTASTDSADAGLNKRAKTEDNESLVDTTA